MTSQVTIMVGEGEYESVRTLRLVEQDLLATQKVEVTFCPTDRLEDHPNYPVSSFQGLEALADADLLIVFTRWRRLRDEQMELLLSYLERGGAVVGFRTSTHAFHYPDDSRWTSWNERFGRDVLGSPWITHHGHSSTTEVSWESEEPNPLLEGVDRHFRSPSWLYQTELAEGAQVLLHGDPVDPECPPIPGPVAWTRQNQWGGRVFYTSLGHPDDFAIPSFRNLVNNAVRWALDGDKSST